MPKTFDLNFCWTFLLQAEPAALWPFVSDTNMFLKRAGQFSANTNSFSKNASNGFLDISANKISGNHTWKEEPYYWEKPFRFGTAREYKASVLKSLKFDVQLVPETYGTKLIINLRLKAQKNYLQHFLRTYVERSVKKNVSAFVHECDQAAFTQSLPYESAKKARLTNGALSKIAKIERELLQITRRHRIIKHLISFITQASDEELKTIHPYRLADYWGEKKYSVLNVFLHATKLGLLNFRWDVFCPNCKKTNHSFNKMKDINPNLFCEHCQCNITIDFNENIHLVFSPNTQIRKITGYSYCFGGPQITPHRVVQHYLKSGDEKFLDVYLEEGTYLLKTSANDGFLRLHLRKDANDTANIYITNEAFDEQETTISIQPNLSIVNNSDNDLLCYLEKENWRAEAIYATEVTSSHDFRTLFAEETLRDGQKVLASNLTILFTDLMNSTELYLQEGDEFAIGQLMSHFKIIQQIVAEERGGIVKTIGDSVMAVFREPVSALKAVERIQQIFSSSTAMGESFKLKAGIHLGDCTAVNLNDRIDYFGTSVNIASRLVDVASEKEIVVSEPFYNFADTDLYLDNNRKTLFIKTGEKELKGFDSETFKVKQISMERTTMKLVI